LDLLLLSCRFPMFVHSGFVFIDITSSVFFFFFQAEDGIRDRNVTGVQTCALPIFGDENIRVFPISNWTEADIWEYIGARELRLRSEERRVGKECRSRWGPEE